MLLRLGSLFNERVRLVTGVDGVLLMTGRVCGGRVRGDSGQSKVGEYWLAELRVTILGHNINKM